MSRLPLLVTLMLAAYALVTLAATPIVVALSRRWLAHRPAVGSRAWLALRLSPVAAAVAIVAGLILPAFLAYEPERDTEAVGPVLVGLAIVGGAMLASAAFRLARAAWSGWRFNRICLGSAATSRVEGTALPLHVIERGGPLVALVGVLRPRLVLSSHVRTVCSDNELAAIAAHEAAHLGARDNLKRLLLDVCPDPLRFSPAHATIVAAWSSAAEQEADDAAVDPHDADARAALAALLVKLARLSTGPVAVPRLSSPLIGSDDLAARVHRLLDEPQAPRPAGNWSGPIAGATAATAFGWTWSAPEVLEGVHKAAELLVQLGR